MKTSRQQTLPLGEGKSTSSQGDFHANLSQWQERDLEQKMTATSGRICCEQYARYSPLGSLVRTLLGSSRWYSPARSLKWVVKPLYSMRVTEREMNNLTQSKKYAKVLNVRDIQSNRLLFQLVPLVRPTGGTEYGLLPTVQTQGLKVNKDGKSIPMNLTLLPTPNAAEGEKWTTKYNPNSQMGKGLTAMACSGLLPTPTAKDGQGGSEQTHEREEVQAKRANIFCNAERPSSWETSSHPDSNGLENRNASGKQHTQSRHGFKAFSRKTDWADFPTQSPICGRDDGLSLGLVNITFPKWRAESVKALGNAIVPQVIYEIFKSIENYDK